MRVRAGALTDVGRERAHNEDALAIVPEHHLYVVADGMGGHNAGEVASKLAVDAMVDFVRGARERNDTPPAGYHMDDDPDRDLLVASIKAANRAVLERAVGEQSGMGTTIVAALVGRDGTELHIAHVGDSRCYRARGDRLELLTRDHSLINDYRAQMPDAPEEELENVPSNVITRAIGMHAQVEVDVLVDKPREGDVYLLCSDGLSGMLRDADILAAVRASADAGRPDVQRLAERLIEDANERGGDDNITVVVLAFE
ncbi:MAG: protein phosphatase 2C domain-containing protein [Myxococcota bacterium]|nr:protein phosphatase 2C domain-containing protein [Myxococcota bacterium]